MHDGYLFTLGICGSAGGPAAAALDLMLSALPPVKRAAYLGEVLVAEGAPSLDDPLLPLILADIADAEVLLIVTPLPGGRLPPRLAALLGQTLPPPARGDRFAALVGLGTEGRGLTALRQWLARQGFAQVDAILLPADGEAAALGETLAATARRVYDLAKLQRPEALR